MTKLDADDLVIFARVAEAGSFSRAAERMRLPKSTVSRRITALEKRLGERLILRNTRKLSITNFGMHLLDHARTLLSAVDGAIALAQHRQAKPSGRLKVSLPGDLAAAMLSEMLSDFVRDHPGISLEIDLSARRVDLIGEGFDVAVRLGTLADDSQLAAHKLGEIQAGLFAAPEYIKRAKAPKKPDDLLTLHGLVMMVPSGEPREWVLRDPSTPSSGTWRGRPAQCTTANGPHLLMNMAIAGFGVVALPDVLAHKAVSRGELVRVLADWRSPPMECWAVFPGRGLMPTRTRAFVDALIAAFASKRSDKRAPSPSNEVRAGNRSRQAAR